MLKMSFFLLIITEYDFLIKKIRRHTKVAPYLNYYLQPVKKHT